MATSEKTGPHTTAAADDAITPAPAPQSNVDLRSVDPEKAHNLQQKGVSRVEAFSRLFHRSHPVAITMYVCILAVSVSFCLDQSTTSAYDVYATAAFNRQSYIGTIDIAEGIIVAVSKPFIAKLCDVFSRQTAYIFILSSYVLGYIIVASAPTAPALCVGRVIAATGQAGLDLTTDIIVGDLTPLEWRGFASAMTSFPYLFLPFVGSKIQSSLCSDNTDTCWRWGFGMFCIIAPVLVSPIIATLYYADYKAKQAGELSFAASRLEVREATENNTMNIQRASLGKRFTTLGDLLNEIDIIGLLLLALGFALVLLPFSLARDADGGWSNPSMIAMITVGFVVLIMFLSWEIFFAPFPILNRRVWHNKTFICAVIIDIFYMVSGNVRSIYYSTWVLVIKDWSTYRWGNFTNITTVCLTGFGLLAGLYHRYFHRYKVLQIFGLSLRILALGLTYWAVGPNATTTALIFTQILNSAGGACSVVGTRVASQASVPHQDLAAIIAQLSLWTKLGSSVGSAIASSMYTSTYRTNLLNQGLSTNETAIFYGSSTTARNTFEWGSEERELGIKAFTNTVRPMFLTGLCLAVIPLFAGLMMPNYYLGKAQNIVDGTSNGGLIVEEAQVGRDAEDERTAEGGKKWYQKVWAGVKN